MHFLIALVCLFVLLVGWGVPQDDVWEVGRLAAPSAGDVSPAEAAGVEIGDSVVTVSGSDIETFDDLRVALAATEPGDEGLVTVERDGELVDLQVVLGDNGEGLSFLGIGAYHPAQEVGVAAAVPRTATEFASFSWQSMGALADFFSPSGLSGFVSQAVDVSPGDDATAVDEETTTAADEENSNRVLSIYGAARIGTQAANTGVAALLGFMVLINIFIGIFNLVPLLPLDGGHVAVASYERIRELMARTNQRYHADVAKLMPLTYVVVFVLVSVGLVALYMDIFDPVNLE
jgi:membrane-associated protease RseP (regulator of RpoE activity)